MPTMTNKQKRLSYKEKSGLLGLDPVSRDKRKALGMLRSVIKYHKKFFDFPLLGERNVKFPYPEIAIPQEIEPKTKLDYIKLLDIVFDACWCNSYKVRNEKLINTLGRYIRPILRVLPNRKQIGRHNNAGIAHKDYIPTYNVPLWSISRKHKGIDV